MVYVGQHADVFIVDVETTIPWYMVRGKTGQSDTAEILFYPHVCLSVGCLTSQQQASVSQGRICSDNFT